MSFDKPSNSADSTPTNPFFQPSEASLRLSTEAQKELALPLPKPTDLPITQGPSKFSDTIAEGPKFPDTKIEGALLADRKFKPSEAMSARIADKPFDQMTQGNGRIPLDALYQMESKKKVA